MSKIPAAAPDNPEEELPPAYEAGGTSASAEKLPLATLYIANNHIFAGGPEEPPLYELSHDIGYLRETTRSVALERLDHVVKTRNGAPELSTRKRHIFDLKHPGRMTGPAFPFHGDAASKSCLCSFGFETFRPPGVRKLSLSSTKAFRVMRAAHRLDKQLVSMGQLLQATPSRDSAVDYEWRDAQGDIVAREVDSDGLRSLVISAEMTQGLRDVLVGAWVIRVWWRVAGIHDASRPGGSARWFRSDRDTSIRIGDSGTQLG